MVFVEYPIFYCLVPNNGFLFPVEQPVLPDDLCSLHRRFVDIMLFKCLVETQYSCGFLTP